MLTMNMIITLVVGILVVLGQVAAIDVRGIAADQALAGRDAAKANHNVLGRSFADGLANVLRRDAVTTTVYVTDCGTSVPGTSVPTPETPAVMTSTPVPVLSTSTSSVMTTPGSPTPASAPPPSMVTPELPGSSISTTASVVSSASSITSSVESNTSGSSFSTTPSVVSTTSSHATTSNSAAPSSDAARYDNYGVAFAAAVGVAVLAVV